jgi:hypothetical protein
MLNGLRIIIRLILNREPQAIKAIFLQDLNKLMNLKEN